MNKFRATLPKNKIKKWNNSFNVQPKVPLKKKLYSFNNKKNKINHVEVAAILKNLKQVFTFINKSKDNIRRLSYKNTNRRIRKILLPVLLKSLKRDLFKKFSYFDKTNIFRIFKTSPFRWNTPNKNTDIVSTEFYHLWFLKSRIKTLFNKRRSQSITSRGYAKYVWKTFRATFYDFNARKIKRNLQLNWRNALQHKFIAEQGPLYYKPLKNMLFLSMKRLFLANRINKRGWKRFKKAVYLRMLVSKNSCEKKKYDKYIRNWKNSKRAAKLHTLHSTLNMLRYKVLKNRYIKYVKKYRFISQPSRANLYFNLLSGMSNLKLGRQVLSGKNNWLNYLNLTKRRVYNTQHLLSKRRWSSLNSGINTQAYNFFDFYNISSQNNITRSLDTYAIQKLNKINLWKVPKPVLNYINYSNKSEKLFFKSKLYNKLFDKKKNFEAKSKKLYIHIKTLNKKLYRSVFLPKLRKKSNELLKNISELEKATLLWFNFKVKTNADTAPSTVYSLPSRLRKPTKKTNYRGLNIHLTQKNYFFTIVDPLTGAVKKVFSSGYSKAKTTKLRRSSMMFTLVFNLLMDYFKNKNINKLKFVRLVQHSLTPKNISFEDEKKLTWYVNQFKHANIRVRRWIYELKRPHSLPLRGPKLRRK